MSDDYEHMQITNAEMDILNEVASIGAGNATTALSQLLNRKIALNLPETIIVNMDKVNELFKDNQEIVVGIDLAFFGELLGRIFLYFPRYDALTLTEMFLQTGKEHKTINDMDISFFKEVTNIVASSYVNSLAKICDFEILPSVPHLTTDMLSETIKALVIREAPRGDLNLFVNVKLEIEGTHIIGNMLLFFDEHSLKNIITKLKGKRQ